MKRLCTQCGTTLRHSDQFDAAYCPRCNTWAERACGATGCIYCDNRPEEPNCPLCKGAGKVGQPVAILPPEPTPDLPDIRCPACDGDGVAKPYLQPTAKGRSN